MGFVLIYVTHKHMEDAEKISHHLLNKKLVACVNYFPIKSSYWWKWNIESTEEIVSLLKTKSANWEKVRDEVLEMHPYETPCIMKMSVDANDGYSSWIEKETI